ncbi:hypothetical protein F1737_04335 [Methanoplanus sp. FWC-SCC4]|uniref:Uncharacterized protein n=1 Tax=Methanochimaera problematica TaxID=2609417 RepID=A0AA97FDE6_9EURY|nr:hypothetical protein [Methanoplanus sp. FWC-SCC4]WOF15983.1 hypothetical protein F1737_04335 [Methanoplanus sp. FWC-SCC4]
MSHRNDVIRLQGYIREPALRNATRELQKIYGDNELIREAIRCLSRREGLLPSEREEISA